EVPRLHERGGPGPRDLSASRLLAWYEPRRAAYPWRADPHPYGVLVSEVMLQQTQVSRVVPAYLRFLARFPTPAALADASPGVVPRFAVPPRRGSTGPTPGPGTPP